MITAEAVREALLAPMPLPPLGSPIDTREAKPAAVLVPIRLGPDPAVFLVLRGAELKDHGGEVGFPGGKPEPGDADLTATALRELREEVGVGADEVEVLGALRPMPVITGRYLIHPFVGALRDGVVPRVASAEVARVIVLPILPILDGSLPFGAVRAEWKGESLYAPHFPIDGAMLYGASAYIFYELLTRLAAKLGRAVPEPSVDEIPPWGDRYARAARLAGES